MAQLLRFPRSRMKKRLALRKQVVVEENENSSITAGRVNRKSKSDASVNRDNIAGSSGNELEDHISQLNRLQSDDPEFYQFLQSHDKNLLNFEADLDNEANLTANDDNDASDAEDIDDNEPRKSKSSKQLDDDEEAEQKTERQEYVTYAALETLLSEAGLLGASPNDTTYDWVAVKKVIHYFCIVCQGYFDCEALTSDNPIDQRKRKLDKTLEALDVDDIDPDALKISYLLKSKGEERKRQRTTGQLNDTQSNHHSERQNKILVIFDSRESTELLFSCVLRNIPGVVYHRLGSSLSDDERRELNHKNIIQFMIQLLKSSNMKAIEKLFSSVQALLQKLIQSLVSHVTTSSSDSQAELLNALCLKDEGFLVQMLPLFLFSCHVCSRFDVEVNKMKLKKLIKWLISSSLSHLDPKDGLSIDCLDLVRSCLECACKIDAICKIETGLAGKLIKIVIDVYFHKCEYVASKLFKSNSQQNENNDDDYFGFILNILNGDDNNEEEDDDKKKKKVVNTGSSISVLLHQLSTLSLSVCGILSSSSSKRLSTIVCKVVGSSLHGISKAISDISKTNDEKLLAKKMVNNVAFSLELTLLTRLSSSSLIAAETNATLTILCKHVKLCNEPGQLLPAILCMMLSISCQQVMACNLNKFVPSSLCALSALNAVIHIKKISIHSPSGHQVCWLLLHDVLALIDSDLAIYRYHPAFAEYAFPIAASLKKSAKELARLLKSSSSSSSHSHRRKDDDIVEDASVIRIKSVSQKAIDWSKYVREVRVQPMILDEKDDDKFEYMTIEYASRHGIEPLKVPIANTIKSGNSSLPTPPVLNQTQQLSQTAVERWIETIKSRVSKGILKHFLPLIVYGFEVERDDVIVKPKQSSKKKNKRKKRASAVGAMVEDVEDNDGEKLGDEEDRLEEFVA